MKYHYFLLALIVLLLAALACALPSIPAEEAQPTDERVEVIVPEPTEPLPASPTENPTAEVPNEEPFACGSGLVAANAFSVEFCYPEQYSSGYTQVMVVESLPSDDLPIWGVHPDIIELALTGYPVDNRYHDPTVWIYPVADLVALDPAFQNIVNELKSLLTSQNPNPENIPFLPLFNAAQMMQAQVAYLGFQNGQGVRFITQYGQAFLPISNDSTFYAFIGLTNDGAYLISATLPVTHPFFSQDGMTEPEEGWESFIESFPAYVDTMEADLADQPEESFYPNLATLDDMMASFLIPPDTIP